MYGGDEVAAIILDIGSHTCKAGYAGEDTPKAVFPSVVGVVDEKLLPSVKRKDTSSDGERAGSGAGGGTGDGEATPFPGTKFRKMSGERRLYVGGTAMGYRREYMEAVPAVKEGLVMDWEAMEGIWDHALRDRLLVEPSEHPLLLAEHPLNPAAMREKCVENVFEKVGVPALFLARNSVLTAFACGRATALVVDSSASGTTVTPVHDGYVLQKGVVRSRLGGNFLADCVLSLLTTTHGAKVRPRYSFKKKLIQPGEFEVVELDVPNTTESYQLYTQRGIAAEVLESVCRVPDSAFEHNAYMHMPTVAYELPDGQVVEIGSERFIVPDTIFNPKHIKTLPVKLQPYLQDGEDVNNLLGLPQMVIKSIGLCDADIRRDLFSSVLLAGGLSMLPQMKERVEKELLEEAPQTAKVKVIGSANPIERRFSTWIGGSILASLGSFQQMWLSRAEYDEHGPSYVHRKCP